jgi:branched-chain amino acid transport system ATP-binding protein
MLTLDDLHAWYGDSHVLHGVKLQVGEGEVVSLLGRNGAGKSTTLKSIMGLMPKRRGSVNFRGDEMIARSPDAIARAGIAYCPEERGIFSGLSVAENLALPPILRPGGMSKADIELLFPNLKERAKSQGTKLSGGEQQMLAIARILRTGARYLLLDEPTEGLAPIVVQQIGNLISEIKKRGFTVLLVEQNFQFAGYFADRHYIMEGGKVVDRMSSADLKANADKVRNYLGL